MVQVIRVAPIDGGWALVCEGVTEPSLYLSGARAEATARKTAARLAEAGQDTRVDILDRDLRPVGSYNFMGHARRMAEFGVG